MCVCVCDRSVAIALLTDSRTWKESMTCCVKEDGRFITPMRMLIEHMPGLKLQCTCMPALEYHNNISLEYGLQGTIKNVRLYFVPASCFSVIMPGDFIVVFILSRCYTSSTVVYFFIHRCVEFSSHKVCGTTYTQRPPW